MQTGRVGGEGLKGIDHTENTDTGDEQCALMYSNSTEM